MDSLVYTKTHLLHTLKYYIVYLGIFCFMCSEPNALVVI